MIIRNYELDVIVIGKGIEGLCAALLAAASGQRVAVFYLSDAVSPQSATGRNQAWLHWGSLYRNDAPEAAYLMATEAERMLELANIRSPEMWGGIFGVDSDEEAEAFLESMRKKRLPTELVSENDARRLLQDCRTKHHFWVKDRPFDEERLMNNLTQAIEELGGRFYELEVNEPARLVRDHGAANGFYVHALGRKFEARVTLLCAGFGIPAILEDLKIPHDLEIFISPLMRIPDYEMVRVPLYVNLSTGLSLLRHSESGANPRVWNIIGDWQRRLLRREERLIWRVTPAEVESLENRLPEVWRALARRNRFPVTAGPKIEIVGPDGRSTVDSWTFDATPFGFLNLFAAIPGKATMAYRTARQLARMAGIIAGEDKGIDLHDPLGGPAGGGGGPAGGSGQASRFWMHWRYPRLDDRE